MSRSLLIGDWTCPSGNNVVAYLVTTAPDLGEVRMEWDQAPPLSAADELYYVVVIRPALIQRVREYAERVGGATLVLTR